MNPKKRAKAPPFVMLEKRQLLASPAWMKLNGASVKVYIFLRSKTYGSLANSDTLRTEIKIPYSILSKDTGLSRQSVRNSLIQLENLGLIDLKVQGGLKSGGYTANVFSLSARFEKYGSDKFVRGRLKKREGSS